MRRSFNSLWTLGLVVAVMVVSGGARGQQVTPAHDPNLIDSELRDVREYRMHVSDVMDVKLPYSPEYDQSVTVQPDGRVRLREIPEIVAVGATPSELEEKIAKAYGSILNKPSVSIILRDFQKPSYFASGEVGKPGRYVLRDDVTLLQAISEAGGMVNERAKKKQVILFRPMNNGTYETKSFDVTTLLKPKGITEPVRIMPGDIIYVPQNRISKIQKYLPTASLGAAMTPVL
jgi:polysaccharide export outer membrane protein